MPGTRAFFNGSVILAAVLLLAFVAGTFQAPADAPSDDVATGQAVWRSVGCESCHTMLGQGGNYAPDLTHIFNQRGETYIRNFLADPQAYHPDARVMPRFDLAHNEVDTLLAFLEWVGQTRAATVWPPRPISAAGKGGLNIGEVSEDSDTIIETPVERGRRLFFSAPAVCSTCHSLSPTTNIVGPSLAGIADRAGTRIPGMSAEDYLWTSIMSPSAYIVEGFQNVMAQNLALVLSSQDISDIIAFLLTLTEGDGS